MKRSTAAAYHARGLGSERLIAAIQAELVPWALGLDDPVRERVGVRERGE